MDAEERHRRMAGAAVSGYIRAFTGLMLRRRDTVDHTDAPTFTNLHPSAILEDDDERQH